MMKRILSAVVVVSFALVGCGGGSQTITTNEGDSQGSRPGMTWTEFRALVAQEPDTGMFIVNGDVPVSGEAALREFYETNIAAGQLIIHQMNQVDQKWNDTEKLTLTYCVSKKFDGFLFSDKYPQVVKAMADATGAWEKVTNVKYVHKVEEDGKCDAKNQNVVFDVRPSYAFGLYLARAFFPGNPRADRNVLIDRSSFGRTELPDLTGILRHELGHTLGFRHEHTRPESGECFEDNNWRALTEYDAQSVMHYPQCNGKGDWSLSLTEKDVAGIQQIYGKKQ
jgi:serine protease